MVGRQIILVFLSKFFERNSKLGKFPESFYMYIVTIGYGRKIHSFMIKKIENKNKQCCTYFLSRVNKISKIGAYLIKLG